MVDQARKMTRKQFLMTTAGLLGVGLAAACGDEDPDDSGDTGTDDAGGCDADPGVSIQNNHAHGLTVPLADVEDGTDKSYVLTGSHSHTLDVTAGHFDKLKSDGFVSISTSQDDGHNHIIELSC